MVINIGQAKMHNYEYIQEEIRMVVSAAAGKTVKVIIETCYLTDEEKTALNNPDSYTIEDQSIVFVQDVEELFDGDIGIFVVDNDVMCKRYREDGENKWLEPDNKSSEYKTICLKSVISKGK